MKNVICSSVGDVADYGNQYARIPVFRIDQPMAAQRIANDVDMFVLAQGSMARMEQRLSELTGKPVLSSPVLGVKGLRKFLSLP